MERILTGAQMKAADASAIAGGMPSLVLMERAALAVADEIEKRNWDKSRILAVCGTGNNGGDGVAAARILAERGFRVFVCLVGKPEKYSEQLRTQLKIAEKYPVTFVNSFTAAEYTVIIDALFGVGLARELKGDFLEAVHKINAGNAKVLAVDLPSGIHTDSGRVLGAAVNADVTLTLAYKKPGLLFYPGASCAGEVVLRKIGISAPEISDRDSLYRLEEKDIRNLPPRDESGNKGTFQKLLVIAGSDTICGAAYLAAKAALRTGIGMVRIFTAPQNRTALSVLLPEALIDTWTEPEIDREALNHLLAWADAVAIGPGLSQSSFAEKLLRNFLELNHLPCVMDADALNLMAKAPELWDQILFPCTITPHIGEMCRLTGKTAEEIKESPLETARNFAASRGVICHLKDARSITAAPDGTCYVTDTGDSSLATAGSGDVLAGLTAGLLCRQRDIAFPAAAAGAWIHGLCGQEAARRLSRAAVTASDLLNEIHRFL